MYEQSHKVAELIKTVGFLLPQEFIDFYKDSDGGVFTDGDNYLEVWPASELMELNVSYGVDTYAPEFFIFGSDGGGVAYALEKASGHVFKMQFIGMSSEESELTEKSFRQFMQRFDESHQL